MSKELKPCPFCGREPIILKISAYTRKHLIKCNGCKIAPEVVCKDKLTTITAWNQRAQPKISDYLEANKPMLTKTKAKMVTLESLKEFTGL